MQNNLNRWYDASIGRWLSEDPIGFNAGDANLYRYVGNGPTNGTDLRGVVQNVGWGLPSWHDYWYYLTHPGEQDKDIQTAQTVAVTTSAVCLVAAGGVAAWGAAGGATMTFATVDGGVVYGVSAGGQTTFQVLVQGVGVTGFPAGFVAEAGYWSSISGVPILFPAAALASTAGNTCYGAAWHAFLAGWGL